MKSILYLNNLKCADCASKIERKIAASFGFANVNLTFASGKLTFETGLERSEYLPKVRSIVKAIEDGVTVTEHKQVEESSRKGRIIFFVTMGLSAALLPAGFLCGNRIAELVLYLTAYLLAGWDVLLKAVRNIFKGKVFDEMFLMTAATIGAIVIGQYPEAVFVMIFYKAGEFFQDLAVNKSKRSISALIDLKGESVTVERDGKTAIIPPEEVFAGDIMVLKAGERLNVDGIVVSGAGDIDTSALTGESLPRRAEAGTEILAGSVNLSGLFRIKAVRTCGESAVSRILDMVQNAADKKAKRERFVSKFSGIYTPVVVGLAVLIAVFMPFALKISWQESVGRALVFLVVSCPCALVISIPLGFFGGIGGASKKGVLFKGSEYLENMTDVKKVVFDKTGTLTKGRFSVTEVRFSGVGREELISLAYAVESGSKHPLALSITDYAVSRGIKCSGGITGYREKAGYGAEALVGGQRILCGNQKYMSENGIKTKDSPDGTVVYVAKNQDYLGCIALGDSLKADSKEAVAELAKMGISSVILTGDRRAAAEKIAGELGITEVYSDLLPGGKVEQLEKLLSANNGKVVFVGDGINDSPALARADIGIAMGAMGSDAAIEAADCVIIDDSPKKVATAIRCAKKTKRIVTQNIVISLAVKFIVLGLAAASIAGLWMGILADVGVSLLAVINSMRALRVKN